MLETVVTWGSNLQISLQMAYNKEICIAFAFPTDGASQSFVAIKCTAFVISKREYVSNVSEDITVGKQIMQVFATSRDIEANAEILYPGPETRNDESCYLAVKLLITEKLAAQPQAPHGEWKLRQTDRRHPSERDKTTSADCCAVENLISDTEENVSISVGFGALLWLLQSDKDIDKCRQQLHDINVPLEVFEYIDQGRNPQLYTKECLERALAKNEQVKGKIDTIRKFKSLLILELGKVFPEEMSKYKALRGEDSPS
ncbi:MED10 polymerase, partial [Polypterus senegalus]